MDDIESVLPSEDDHYAFPHGEEKEEEVKDSTEEVKIRRLKRLIVVEPLIILMASSWYPLLLSGQLYVHDKFEEQVKRETGYNDTQSGVNGTNTCETNKSSPQYIFTQQVQSENAYFNMWCNVAMTVPAFFSTMLLSPYSDRAGRKYAILPPVITGLIYAIIYCIIILTDASVWYVLIAYFIEGVGGSFMLLFVGMNSYMADVSSPQNLRFRLTLLYILMMAISSAGPVAFGYWINHSGYLWPSLFTVIMRILTLFYAIIFVPETVVPIKKPTLFTLKHLKIGIAVFTKKTENNRTSKLIMLLVIFLLCYMGNSEMKVDTLFELNQPFCWDSVTIGYYSTAYMAVSAIGGLVTAKLMGLCASDLVTALVGGVASAAHYIYKGFVDTTFQLFLTCAFPMFSVLLTPSVKTVMSKLVSSSEQGAVFGALALVEIVCSFAGGLLMNAVYANTLWILPGFVFIVSGLFYLLGTIVLIIYTVREKMATSNKYKPLEEVIKE